MDQLMQKFRFNPELPGSGQNKNKNKNKNTDRSERIVNVVFNNLYGLYPTQFKKAFSCQPEIDQAKTVWMQALVEAEVTSIRQLELAFIQLIYEKNAYLPSAPAFIHYCLPTPERVGLNTVHQTYMECCRNAHTPSNPAENWSSLFAYNAGRITGFYNLKNLPEKTSYLIFIEVYNQLFKTYIRGVPLQYEAPEKKPVYPDEPPSFDHLQSDLEKIRRIKQLFDD